MGFAGNAIRNSVSIIGAAENIGDYEWKSGLVLQDIINDPLDLLPNADFAYGLIRRREANGDIHCLSFVPSDLFISGKAKRFLWKNKTNLFFCSENQGKKSLRA